MANERSVNLKSPKIIRSDPETTTEIGRFPENVVPSHESIVRFEEELAKIPSEQDFEFLDPVTLYECKIHAILLLQRNLSRYATRRTKYKVGEKNVENIQDTLLGIDVSLLTEVLRER